MCAYLYGGTDVSILVCGDRTSLVLPFDIHDEQVDGALRLTYEGQVLEDGKRMEHYPLARAMKQYPRPYAGVVWIAPLES